MKLTFRWYGEADPVTLSQIRQIPQMTGIVSAVYDVAPGGVWSRESIARIRTQAAENGLAFEVVESVPVPEEIKLGTKNAPALLENYCENIRRLGQAGVKCICYNFMPVFDWLRSDLSHVQKDGARALAYDEQAVLAMDPTKRALSLPGWDESYTKAQLRALLAQYAERTEDDLRRSFAAFLEAVVPVAEESGVRLAVHPDDPPWSVFGLPRIVSTEDDLAALLAMQKSEANGITFCTGSLGASAENDLVRMAERFAAHIPFLHLRNVLRTGPRQFEEVAHPTACGSNDIFSIVRALVSHGFDGYVRPDHGRMIWGEQGRGGYGLYDRALGAAYITGLFEGVTKMGGYHE